MNILEIVIQRQTPDGWPVVAKFNQTGDFLPRRWEGTLKLDESDLFPLQLNPLAYGILLGERLFCDSIRDAIREARASSPDRLRVQLIVEAPELRHWRWETLCGPIGVGGKWQHLTLDQRSLYSLYLPSLTDRRFPAIGRPDLRALIVVASPPEGNRYKLGTFSEADAIIGATQSLGNIPHEVLATTAEAAGQPTIDEICWRLTNQHYTILHIVAHGLFRTDDGETILYLLDDKGDVRPITATAFIDRLQNLQGVKGLPHLVFLASCDSAAPEAERAGAMGGLGQRLVRELGVPAVIAMTQRVSVETANELSSKFYERLNDNGDVVGALVDATAYLAEAGDITVPAIYERLGGRLLFDSVVTRELTNVEIISGLERLQALLADQPDRPGRAPILTAELSRYAAQWRRLLLPDAITTPRQQLSPQAQAEWLEAESNINALCEQALDLSFRALALGQEPAPYDARCPFPGLAAFQGEFKAFFFGRENLVAKLVSQWQEHNFLAILGPSGSGKSSLVLAGIAPQMERENPNLQLVYMTPTANPLHQLAAAQLPEVGPKSEILLLVDQFEELFTLCADEKIRQQFLDQLLALTEEMRVVITMRADFWGDCAPYPALRQLMLQQQELIAPMTLPELRSAMEQQADAVGLRFEDDLVHTILSEVEGEPGAMPLLQHLLKGLWERRRGRWLLTKGYRALGGIRQAIAVTAQTIYDNLSREEQTFMKHIFVRLTHLDESGGLGQQRRNTRRRVALQDLAAGGKTVSDVRAFVYKPELRGLLITSQRDDPLQGNDKTNSDDQTDDGGRLVEVEVIHEAVIRHWGQLQEWLDQDYEMLRQQQRIQQEAADWRQAADPSLREGLLLLHGARLLQVKEWRDKGDLALNENENAYVIACDQKEQAQQQREREQLRQLAAAQRQRAEEAEQAAVKQSRLTRIAFAVGGVAFLLFFVAGFLWLAARNSEAKAVASAEQAGTSEANAVANANLAATRESEANESAALAATSEAAAVANANLAATREVEAISNANLAATREAEAIAQAQRALAENLAGQSQLLIQNNQQSTDLALILARDAWLTNQTVNADRALRNALSAVHWRQDFPSANRRHQGAVYSTAFSPDGALIVSGGRDGTIRIWDASDLEPQQLLFGHDGTINSVSFSPDGMSIVSGGADGTVRLWEASNGRQIAILTGHECNQYGSCYVSSVGFSPDGTQIVSAGYDRTVRIWNVATKQQVVAIIAHNGWASSASFSPDGQQIVSGGGDSAVRIWDATTHQLVAEFDPHHGQIYPTGLSPDGRRIISGGGDGTVRLWDLESGEQIDMLPRLSSAIYQVFSTSFSPDGTQVAFGGSYGTLYLWHVDNGQQTKMSIGTNEWIHSVSFSPDGTQIVSGEGDGTIRLWDVNGGQQIAIVDGHGDQVLSVDYSPTKRQIVSGSEDGAIRIWDTISEQQSAIEYGHEGWVLSVRYSPDGEQIVSGGQDGLVRTWSASSLESQHSLSGHNGIVYAVDFSPDGAYIVSAGGDGTVRLWDSASGLQKIDPLIGHVGPVRSVAFSPSGTQIISGGEDGTVRLWDIVSGQHIILNNFRGWVMAVSYSQDETQIAYGGADGIVYIRDVSSGEIAELSGHIKSVLSVHFSPDGKHIVSGGEDGTIRLWNIQSEQQIAELGNHNGYVWSVSYSPDGTQVVSGGADGMARTWSVENWHPYTILNRHESAVRSADVSPDGKLVASGGEDGMIHLSDTVSNKRINELMGHGNGVSSLNFSPDGAMLVSGDYDGVVRLWDITDGQQINELIGHTNMVYAVSFSPDGTQVASSDLSGSVILWNTASGQQSDKLVGHERAVYAIAYAPDGTQIVSGGDDGTVRLWDVESGQQTSELVNGFASVKSVDFSPDGTQIASGYWDGMLRIWSVADEQEIAQFKSHTCRAETFCGVLSVNFSPDGRQIVSSGDDGVTRIWDLDSNQLIAEMSGHHSFVHAVSFSPDGMQIMSAGEDGEVRIWDTPQLLLLKVIMRISRPAPILVADERLRFGIGETVILPEQATLSPLMTKAQVLGLIEQGRMAALSADIALAVDLFQHAIQLDSNLHVKSLTLAHDILSRQIQAVAFEVHNHRVPIGHAVIFCLAQAEVSHITDDSSVCTDVRMQRQLVTADETITGTVQNYNMDLWHFELTAASVVTIDLLANDNNLDTYLYLYTVAGSIISENDWFSSPQHSQIEISLPAGNYLVGVSGYRGSAGGYDLTIVTEP